MGLARRAHERAGARQGRGGGRRLVLAVEDADGLQSDRQVVLLRAPAAERAAHRGGVHVHARGHVEALRLPRRNAAPRRNGARPVADLGGRRARDLRRRACCCSASARARSPSCSPARWPSPTSSSTSRKSAWPTVNGGVSAVLYCFVWLYISAAGPGPWSLDARRKRG